jgi:hypothetical protein
MIINLLNIQFNIIHKQNFQINKTKLNILK